MIHNFRGDLRLPLFLFQQPEVKAKSIEASVRNSEVRVKSIEANARNIEAEVKSIEADTQSIEAETKSIGFVLPDRKLLKNDHLAIPRNMKDLDDGVFIVGW